MPVFHHPRTVIVDEGGSGLAAAAAVVALAVVVSSAAALITDALLCILTGLGVLAITGTGYLVHVLRRDGLWLVLPGAPAADPAVVHVTVSQPAARPAQALSAPRPLAIGAPVRRADPDPEGLRSPATVVRRHSTQEERQRKP